MTRDDTHDRCLVCLGEDHDMAKCSCCRQLQLRTRVERARALLLWRNQVTAWPLSRRAYETKRKAGDFEGLEYLSEEYIHRFLGITGPPLGSVTQQGGEPQQGRSGAQTLATAGQAPLGPQTRSRSPSPLSQISEHDLLNLTFVSDDLPTDAFTGEPRYKWSKRGSHKTVFRGTNREFARWRADNTGEAYTADEPVDLVDEEEDDSFQDPHYSPGLGEDIMFPQFGSTTSPAQFDAPVAPTTTATGEPSNAQLAEMLRKSQEAFQRQIDEIKQSVKPKETVTRPVGTSIRTSLVGHAAPRSTLDVVDLTMPVPAQSLGRIPRMSPAARTSAWAAGASPPTTPLGRVNISDDDAESVYSLPPLQGMTGVNPARQLGEGQSPYDWDIGGVKYPYKEELQVHSLARQRLDKNQEWAPLVAQVTNVPQDIKVARQPDPFHLSQDPYAPQQTVLRLSNASREAWETSRSHRSMKDQNLLSPSVRKGYRLTKDDWAFLGAVRRPDDLLVHLARGRGTAKTSTKGVPSLQGHKNLTARATDLHEQVQFSAHLMRPITHGISGTFCLKNLSERLATAAQSGNRTSVLESAKDILGVATFIWSALEDASECLGRFNSDAVRKLRELWLDQASLPTEVGEGLKQIPVTRGTIPAERNAEFTAPLVGEELPRMYDLAYHRSKASQALYRKQKQFKPPVVKRKNPGSGGPQAKKGKPNQQGSGQQTPANQPKTSGTPRGGGARRGRGGRPQNTGRGGGAGTKGRQGDKSQS